MEASCCKLRDRFETRTHTEKQVITRLTRYDLCVGRDENTVTDYGYGASGAGGVIPPNAESVAGILANLFWIVVRIHSGGVSFPSLKFQSTIPPVSQKHSNLNQ